MHARFQSLWDLLWQLKLSGRDLLALMKAMGTLLMKAATASTYFIMIMLGASAACILFELTVLASIYIKLTYIGLIPTYAIEILLTWLLLNKPTSAPIAPTSLLLLLIAFSPDLTLLMVAYLEMVITMLTLMQCPQFIIKFASIVIFHELSWDEINAILNTAMYYVEELFANVTAMLMAKPLSDAFILVKQMPTLLFNTLAPWITRTWATLTASKSNPPTDTEALTMDVENSIYRLVNSTEPSAQQKGELLEALWEKVRIDVGEGKVTYAQGLNKAYGVNSANDDVPHQRTLSFWGIASTRRDSSAEFKAQPTSENSSFSFFGKPTTAEKLKAHVDFSPLPEAACG